jgi:hypothetical protein
MSELYKPNKTRIYKGIPPHLRGNDEELLVAAEDSIYMWWWKFMRLSPVFWYASKTGLSPKDSKVAEAYEKAGNLKINDFSTWWIRHGRYQFSEARAFPEVWAGQFDEIRRSSVMKDSIFLEVPLNISRQRAMKEIRQHLVAYGQGNTTNILQDSTALLKLHTKKYNKLTLEKEYWVLMYKILYPKISTWKIGDRLRLAPHLKVENIDRSKTHFGKDSGPFSLLQSLTGRCLYKAKFARYHMERCEFPNYTKVDLKAANKPFGSRAHSDFLAATSENHESVSAWQLHLRKLHGQELRKKIFTLNRFEIEQMSRQDSQFIFEQYISGESNLLSR